MLQVPLEIAFHNIPSIPWAEEEIRSRVAKLERLYDRLVACRVRVDQRADNSNHTIPPVVRIELGVPGKDLVVSHEPEHLQNKFQSPDLRTAIAEAFRIAELRLTQHKDALTDRARPTHQNDVSHQFLGQIAEIDPAGEFGFILTKEGGMLYFHRNSVLSGDFTALKRGDEVHYVEEAGDTGPTASKVRVKNGA
jgi:cold shock CspA family protein